MAKQYRVDTSEGMAEYIVAPLLLAYTEMIIR